MSDVSGADHEAEHESDHEADHEVDHDAARVAERADLLPEERAAGSEDPEAQAEAILAESDRRTDQPEQTRDESSQTP